MFPNQGFGTTTPQHDFLTGRQERCEMDGTEIANQIKKAELYEAVKQALIRLLDDPQVQQKITEVLGKRIPQKL